MNGGAEASSIRTKVRRRTTRRCKPPVFGASVKFAVTVVTFSLVVFVTVVTTTIGNQHQRRNLLRHPLSFPQQPVAEHQVRYLTLGGPSTWGAGLEVTSNSYPYLLSPYVHNAAEFSADGGPTLASLCTQSIVGDHIYDVITLEYETYVPSSLQLLTQRLRKRFPVAAMVFVKLWTPLDLYYFDSETSRRVSFDEWRRLRDDEQRETTKDSLLRDMKDHIWMLDSTEQRNLDLNYTMGAVDGVVYRLPVPADINSQLDVLVDWFVESRSSVDVYTASFRYTLSRQGHFMVARDLEAVLDQLKVEKSAFAMDAPDTLAGESTLSKTTLVGTWGSGDSCQLWYDTGRGMPVQHLRSLQYTEFSNHYALEVTAPDASMSVYNPFAEDRMLYLTYLTTSAVAGSKKVYPRIKVQVGDDPSHLILDPSHDDNLDVTHRTRTSAVGMVPAQSTAELHFVPLEEYTLNHFRLVGASFLAKEKVSHSIPSEFALLPRRLHIVDEVEYDEEDSELGALYSTIEYWRRHLVSKRTVET
jgi:hypothetical protein